MSEPKFTPGPWKAQDNGWETSTVYNADGLPIATCRIDGRADEYNQDRFERIKEANAHLIAAAPELYEALEKVNPILNDSLAAIGKILVERDRGMGYFHAEVDWLVSRQQEIRYLQKQTRAALAKARGKDE